MRPCFAENPDFSGNLEEIPGRAEARKVFSNEFLASFREAMLSTTLWYKICIFFISALQQGDTVFQVVAGIPQKKENR